MKKYLVSTVLLLVMALVVAGCGGAKTTQGEGDKKEEAASGNVIKVATSSPLSGSQAAMGESIKLGAQMAVEEHKEAFKALGFELELAPQDDQADPKMGVTIAKKLLADKAVMAVVGHLNSGVAIPSSEEYNKGSLAMVSPANTNPAVTDRNLPVVNRICTRDDKQGPAGAQFAKDKLGVKSVFVIHDKTAYGQGLADEFKKEAEKIGITVAGYEGITAGEVDFSAVLTRLGALKPDLIYFGGMYPEAGVLYKQSRDKGITAKFMGGDGLDNSEIVKIAGGKSVIGMMYTTAAAPITTDEGKAWAAKYKEKFGKGVEGYSAYGYDAALVSIKGIENAIKANGNKLPTREQVAQEIRKTQDLKGIVTTVSFDEKGDNKNAKVYIFEFKKDSYPGDLVGEQ